MNRRRFLSSIAAAATALVLDPERLLWVPGAKKIFIPSPRLFTASKFAYLEHTDNMAHQLGERDFTVSVTLSNDGVALTDFIKPVSAGGGLLSGLVCFWDMDE